MRRQYLPEHGLGLEQDVRDVEYCQQPIVSVASKVEILLHTGNLCITTSHQLLSFVESNSSAPTRCSICRGKISGLCISWSAICRTAFISDPTQRSNKRSEVPIQLAHKSSFCSRMDMVARCVRVLFKLSVGLFLVDDLVHVFLFYIVGCRRRCRPPELPQRTHRRLTL